MTAFLPDIRRAIGSSYLIQRSPGAEQVGGLEILLTYPSGVSGRITIENSIYDSSEIRDDLESYTKEASRGLHNYAAENNIDLSAFDITMRRFFVHDVDSRPYLYFLAAQYALRSALAMWRPPSEFR